MNLEMESLNPVAEPLPGGYTDRKMDKIRASANQPSGSLKKGGMDVRGAPRTSVQSAPSRDPLFSGERTSFFSLRQERVESLLRMFSLRHWSSSGMKLSPLKALLVLLKDHQPSPGSRDLQLGEDFLRRWLQKYGESLPKEAHKELSQLVQLLEREQAESSLDLYYMEGNGQDRSRGAHWSLTVARQKDGRTPLGEEEGLSCLLDMTFPRLGKVQALLRYQDQAGRCTFFSGKEVRRLIRKSLSGLQKRVAESGLGSFKVRIAKKRASDHLLEKEPPNGVELWG